MPKIAKALFLMVMGHLIFFSTLGYGDEEELFDLIVAPDALIALDLSGSMGSPPPGDWLYSDAASMSGPYSVCSGNVAYGKPTPTHNIRCLTNYHLCGESDSCTAPYYRASVKHYDPDGVPDSGDEYYTIDCGENRVDCSKREIAKRAIFSILDENKDGKIGTKDETDLGVRMGYMRFFKCKDTFTYSSHDSGYSGGCNQLSEGFQELGQRPQGYFQDLYSKVEKDVKYNGNMTPLAGALDEAKNFLEESKNGNPNASPPIPPDPYKNCRKKFVILITDGLDTLACNAGYGPVEFTKGWTYKRRRATVTAAKALADAGYKVFVVGFGADMPISAINTLNWAAYFGGTDNPDENNSLPTPLISVMSDPCTEDGTCAKFTLNSSNCTSLGEQLDEDCCSKVGTPSAPDCCNLAAHDPGFKPIKGYAFIATDAGALNHALRRAMDTVRQARYSFSIPSVSAARVKTTENDQNYIYEASFIPFVGRDPFWQGHLKKYRLDDSGRVVKPAVLDAGERLRDRTSRSMYTYLGGTLRPFEASISPTYFGYSDDEAGRKARDAIVGYIRGDSEYNEEGWKLGDIFHSHPITIDPPSLYYNDSRSLSAFNAYHTFREKNKSREWIVVVGANDGQFHAFSASTLEEKWSFIPPNLLPKLKLIAHSTEPAPASMSHQFFVDGPVTASEVWLGSGNGLSKSDRDWKTLLVFGLGRGVRDPERNNDPYYLWSSSPNCDSGFSRRYNPPHQYYCGYYAFDVTDTSADPPTFMWRINVKSSKQGRHLDEPWSRMALGRVMIDGNEKWVGFFGGGYNEGTQYEDDDGETRGKRGKGFFVADLSNGDIIWSYTKEDDGNLDYPIPAPPTILDWDNDGFIDTAYIADLGGNIWRFRFCSQTDGSTCNPSTWNRRASRLFNSSGAIRPVFTKPSVAMDTSGQLWVFWGTGNKMNPTETGTQDRFLAVKEKDFRSTYNITHLERLTTRAYSGTMPGWFIELGSGEKMLSDPTVFGGMVLFTTLAPAPMSGDPCLTTVGTGKLYALAMMPMVIDGITYNAGAGLMSRPTEPGSREGGARSVPLGVGIPTAPVVSQKPKGQAGPTDIYLTVSGGGGTEALLESTGTFPNLPFLERLRKTSPQAQVIHWRDRRVQ